HEQEPTVELHHHLLGIATGAELVTDTSTERGQSRARGGEFVGDVGVGLFGLHLQQAIGGEHDRVPHPTHAPDLLQHPTVVTGMGNHYSSGMSRRSEGEFGVAVISVATLSELRNALIHCPACFADCCGSTGTAGMSMVTSLLFSRTASPRRDLRRGRLGKPSPGGAEEAAEAGEAEVAGASCGWVEGADASGGCSRGVSRGVGEGVDSAGAEDVGSDVSADFGGDDTGLKVSMGVRGRVNANCPLTVA